MESVTIKPKSDLIMRCRKHCNTVFVIAGPTASGKSALAVDLSQAVNGVVVNCDSIQLYQNISVLAACPSQEDQEKVEHRLFEVLAPNMRGNVVNWLKQAVKEIQEIWEKDKIPVVVGGTGLYIDNLLNGTTPIPETSKQIREEAKNFLKKEGKEGLYEKIKEIDPESAKTLHANDTTRLLRAYEVWVDTGIPLSEWYKKPMIRHLPQANFVVIKICPTAEELNLRCDKRFDQMLQSGALEEVRSLEKLGLDPSLPAMKALGVSELIHFLHGESSLQQAVELAKIRTRQYAKRQRTWFNNKLTADIKLTHCYNGDFSQVADMLQTCRFLK